MSFKESFVGPKNVYLGAELLRPKRMAADRLLDNHSATDAGRSVGILQPDKVNWKASPTQGVTYDVYSAATSGFTPSASNRIASGITALTYSNSGLPPSTTRYYVLTAQSSSGESAGSNQAAATTRK